MRIALVHDWLTGMRGGEKVLSSLCELLPGADVFALLHRRGSLTGPLARRRVRTTWLDDLPCVGRYYRHLLPLMPLAIEGLDLSAYDLIVSSSHCVAKGVLRRSNAAHVCYCHTPMRYAWSQGHAYDATMGLGGLALRVLRPYLRAWDRRSANHVDHFIANSRNVADRIQRAYGRPAEVVHPPVDTEFFSPGDAEREDFYLVAGALAPYKHAEHAIKACRRLGRRLVVIGAGQQWAKLSRLASDSIQFLGAVSDTSLRDHYRRCRGLLFPGEEDFGIVPVEAMACGCPVIAYGAGGALETVVESGDSRSAGTGLLYSPQTVDGLISAVERFEAESSSWHADRLARWAARYGRNRFLDQMRRVLASASSGSGRCGHIRFRSGLGWKSVRPSSGPSLRAPIQEAPE